MADQKILQKENYNTEHLQSTTSVSSTPKKGNRRAMTDSDVPATVSTAASSPMTSCDLIPSSSSQTSSSPQTSHSTSFIPVPRVGTPRFPVRIGITWKKGEKLEAMDFSRTWYPSKIVEIDAAAKYVLIHFEGWNQRYDEWVAMDSDKLRPVTRHSERKDKGVKKRRIHPHPIYRAGEKVLAKWTDCKKYPAKISRLKEDGMYEVIFYDGLTRLIQPMNIQPLPEDMHDLKTPPPEVPPATKTKLSFKQIKVTLPESVKKVKEKLDRSKLLGESTIIDGKNSVPDDGAVGGDRNKVSSGSSLLANKLFLVKGKLSTKSRMLDKRRRRFKSKKSANLSSTSKSLPGLDRDQTRGTARTYKKRPYTWKIKKFKKLPVEFSQSEASMQPQAECSEDPTYSAAALSVSTTSSSISTAAAITPARKPSVVKDIVGPSSFQAQFLRAVAEQIREENPSSGNGADAQTFGAKRTKRRYNTVPKLHHKHKRIRAKSKEEGVRFGGWTKRLPSLGQVDRAKSLDGGSAIANPSAIIPLPVFVPSKAFIVEEDHNPFKCPHQGCNKDFRKENLLACHIKYYHTEPETTSGGDAHAGVTSPLLHPATLQSPGGTPGSRRRRKKTSSICSTDSDVSISSRGKCSSRRQHHDSEIPITASPDILNKDLWADVKPLRTSQDSMAEESVAVDTEDEEMEADVVNCVCGQRETNGLMIQCDVCMCWQHFACMDTNNSGIPPINYVCRVCENTPGIRESSKYLYDMGWERRGELPSFPFITDCSTEHLRSIACECNEMISALQAIKSALYSTRRQIKISKEDTDQEFQLWQTDWDNWTKPEEDLTLTPCSGDPDPSPTPSTFLFPQAPCSNTVTASTEIFSSDASSDPLMQSSASVPYVSTSGSAVQSSTSSQMSCGTSSLTSILTTVTTTVEVASLLESPPLMSQPSQLRLMEESSKSYSASPASGSQMDTVSSLSSNAALSVPLQTSPGGTSLPLTRRPATNSVAGHTGDGVQSFSSSGSQCMNSQTLSTTQRTEKEQQSPKGEGLREKCDSRNGNKLSSLSENQLCATTVITSQPHGMLSATAADQLVPNGISSHPAPRIQDTTESATSSDPVTLEESVAERQSQLSPSHEDKLNKTASATWAETAVNKHMSSLYVEVSGNQNLQLGHQDEDDDDDAPDNDTDTAEESLDPYRNCEHNLLVHVNRVHADIEKQLEVLEQQIADLENSEHNNPTVQLSQDNVLNDIPALKKSLGKLYRNMVKVQRFCSLH